MATNMKRIMITITPELARGAETLKQKNFYNKTYSEMYRQILSAGLKALQDEPDHTDKRDND